MKSESDRGAMAKAVFRLFDHWELDDREQAALLGLEDNGEQRLAAMRDASLLESSPELNDRALAIARRGAFMASGHKDGSILLWDVASWKLLMMVAMAG